MSLRYLDRSSRVKNKHSGKTKGGKNVSVRAETQREAQRKRFTEEEELTRDYTGGHTRQGGTAVREHPYRARVPAELTALPYDSVKITRLPPLATPIPSAPNRRSRDLSPPPAAHPFANP